VADGWFYILSASIGALVGLAEILSRYRDAPWQAARSPAGLAYIAFNASVSALALLFVREVMPIVNAGQPAQPGGNPLRADLLNAFAAGFGAMAVLRASILTARVGGKDVEVGPAILLDIFRSTMDRSIARVRAETRAARVVEIMGEISFVCSYASLGSFALSLLQSVDADERAAVEQQIGALANQTGRSDRDKALELGLILANSVGFDGLKSSITAIGSRIANNDGRPEFVAKQMERLDPAIALRDLPATCLGLNPDVRDEDQKTLSEQIDAIAASSLSDWAKCVNVGLTIASVLGEESLKSGVDLLERLRKSDRDAQGAANGGGN